MMKYALMLSASLAFGLTAVAAHAADGAGSSLKADDGSYEVAGLAWRCGKNNPAMWGTIGNGCLKQKRAFKKNGSTSSAKPANGFAVQQPAPPPPKLRLTK